MPTDFYCMDPRANEVFQRFAEGKLIVHKVASVLNDASATGLITKAGLEGLEELLLKKTASSEASLDVTAGGDDCGEFQLKETQFGIFVDALLKLDDAMTDSIDKGDAEVKRVTYIPFLHLLNETEKVCKFYQALVSCSPQMWCVQFVSLPC
jgi:hypothetical protein